MAGGALVTVLVLVFCGVRFVVFSLANFFSAADLLSTACFFCAVGIVSASSAVSNTGIVSATDFPLATSAGSVEVSTGMSR